MQEASESKIKYIADEWIEWRNAGGKYYRGADVTTA